MLLGAAKYLAEAGDFNGGNLHLSAHEENGFGAKAMIDEGLFTSSAPTLYSPCTNPRYGAVILPPASAQ